MSSSEARTGRFLAIDTSTRTAVVAVGDADGRVIAEERWSSGHRHGSALASHMDELLTTSDTTLGDLAGVVVGIGPGSFTGLRVGLAAAKVIAYSMAIPICGISSMEAVALGALAAGPGQVAVLLPAGTTDRYLGIVERGATAAPVLVGPPRLVAGGSDLGLAAGTRLLAVDLPAAEAGEEAVAAGAAAVERLTAGLVALGAAALRDGATTRVAELVPAYVALPRGITEAVSGMAWSPDLR